MSAIWTNKVTDNFTRADETMAGGTGNWYLGGDFGGGQPMAVRSNAACGVLAALWAIAESYYDDGGGLTAADQRMTTKVNGSAANGGGGYCRMTNASGTYKGYASYYQFRSTPMYLYAHTRAVSNTILVSYTTPTTTDPDHIRIQCVGTTISIWTDANSGSYTSRGSVTDSLTNAPGWCGLMRQNYSNSTAYSSDDFTVDTYSVTPLVQACIF